MLTLLGCVLLVGCDDHEPAPRPEVRPVRTMIVHSEIWSDVPSQVGEIRSHTESDLGFKIGGKVLERKVELGAVVRKGEILARLDEQDQRNQLHAAQAELSAARASLIQAESEERRQNQLRNSGWATQAKYDAALQARDAARAAVNAAAARRQLAEAQLEYSVLRAPDDSAVAAVGVEPGQVVAAGQMVVRLVDLHQKDAVFTISENTFQRVPQDVDVEVRLLDMPQIVAHGRVAQVSPSADPTTRTYTVKVALNAPPDAMRLGMSVVGRVKQGGQKVISLPSSALFSKNGHPAVWVVDPETSTVDLVPIDLARSDEGRILISGGLSDGATVVTAGVQRLWPGLKVRPIISTVQEGKTP